MDGLDARVPTISPSRPVRYAVTTFGALAWSGFRRYATYRQATIAGSFTNMVFGFLRCYVLLAVGGRARPAAVPAGYDARQLATYVWVGQGLLTRSRPSGAGPSWPTGSAPVTWPPTCCARFTR